MGARRPVAHRVTYDVLDRLTDQLLDLPPEQACRSRVDEGGAALQVDAINAFTRRVQDEFVTPIELRQGRLGPLPLGNFGVQLGVGLLQRRRPLPDPRLQCLQRLLQRRLGLLLLLQQALLVQDPGHHRGQ